MGTKIGANALKTKSVVSMKPPKAEEFKDTQRFTGSLPFLSDKPIIQAEKTRTITPVPNQIDRSTETGVKVTAAPHAVRVEGERLVAERMIYRKLRKPRIRLKSAD